MAVFLQTEIQGLEGGDREPWAGQAARGQLAPRERARTSPVFGEGEEVRELEQEFFPGAPRRRGGDGSGEACSEWQAYSAVTPGPR